MNLENRVLPYLSLGAVTLLCFISTVFIPEGDFKNVLLSVGANGIFFFIAYFFYDIVRRFILKKELRYIHQHIRQQISSSIFSYLYFVKKIVYGYNLDTNTIENIMGIAKLKKSEIKNHVANQSYLGFQIFKSSSEVRSLFNEIGKDSIFLKFSSHLDSIGLLKISNNLTKLELIYKNQENFKACAEKGIEFKVVDGKTLNPANDDKLLLMKSTAHDSRFVVYDSGYFETDTRELLLNRYVLKPEVAEFVSAVMQETLILMSNWLPQENDIASPNSMFRVIKGFFSEKTDMNNKENNLFVADIVEYKNRI